MYTFQKANDRFINILNNYKLLDFLSSFISSFGTKKIKIKLINWQLLEPKKNQNNRKLSDGFT